MLDDMNVWKYTYIKFYKFLTSLIVFQSGLSFGSHRRHRLEHDNKVKWNMKKGKTEGLK